MVGTLAMLLAAGSGMAAGKSEKSAAVSPPDLSSSYKSSDLMDMSVRNQQNEDLGNISELIVDKDGKISHVVLSEGGVAGVGGNEYIVPWDRVQLSDREAVAQIDVNRDALASEFAAFEEDLPTAGETKKYDESEKDSSDVMREDGKPSSTNP
jgi:sporulation protein YlmC with PRC-barrel domain